MKKLTYILFFGAMAWACSSGSKEKSGELSAMSSRDKIRLRQYQVQGTQVYATYCISCHQKDGKGLASLYPPLAGSDYLMENLPRAACIIKNGQSKEIVVNGVTYNQMMPAHPITHLEIAEVLTFIGNTWGNEAGLIGVKDVDKWVKACEEGY